MACLIIDIDPPESCWSCRFRNRGYCVADKENRYVGMGAEVMDRDDKKPWCPAKNPDEEFNSAKNIVETLSTADYLHNFQHERSDIVDYIKWTTAIIREAKMWNKRRSNN